MHFLSSLLKGQNFVKRSHMGESNLEEEVPMLRWILHQRKQQGVLTESQTHFNFSHTCQFQAFFILYAVLSHASSLAICEME